MGEDFNSAKNEVHYVFKWKMGVVSRGIVEGKEIFVSGAERGEERLPSTPRNENEGKMTT